MYPSSVFNTINIWKLNSRRIPKFEEAKASSASMHCFEAREEEMESIRKSKVRELVDYPKEETPLGITGLIKLKPNMMKPLVNTKEGQLPI